MNLRHYILYGLLAMLMTHELDAVAQSEWRLLYVLRDLPPAQGQFWFVLLHVPLFAALLAMMRHANVSVRDRTEQALAIFAVIHAGLHFRLSADPLYTFHSLLSQSLIYGAAVLALYFLWLSRHKSLDTPTSE